MEKATKGEKLISPVEIDIFKTNTIYKSEIKDFLQA